MKFRLLCCAAPVLIMLSAATAASAQFSDGAAAPAVAAPAVVKPHLLVSAFKTEPEPVEPGANFTLSLDIMNTSKKKAENLLVSLVSISAAGGSGSEAGGQSAGAINAFATRVSGNSRYLGILNSGAVGKTSFDLAVSPKAEPGLYVAQIELSYSGSGSGFTAAQSVGVRVSRKAAVELQNVSVPETVKTGRSFPISFEAVNTGGFSVRSVVLRAVGNQMRIEDGVNVVGSLEAGDSDSLEARARAGRPGVAKVDLVLEYRDDFNQSRTIKKTVEIDIKAEPKSPRPVVKEEAGGFLQAVGKFLRALFGLG